MTATRCLVDSLDILEEINKFVRSFEGERRQTSRDLQGAPGVLAPKLNSPTEEEQSQRGLLTCWMW